MSSPGFHPVVWIILCSVHVHISHCGSTNITIVSRSFHFMSSGFPKSQVLSMCFQHTFNKSLLQKPVLFVSCTLLFLLLSVSPFKSNLLSGEWQKRCRQCRSRRTTGQFVQSEAKTEKESDSGRVKPPRVWWWLETSLTQTMRRRMTTSSAWRVCLWRLSSHNEMALWIIFTPQTCTHNDTHKHI